MRITSPPRGRPQAVGALVAPVPSGAAAAGRGVMLARVMTFAVLAFVALAPSGALPRAGA